MVTTDRRVKIYYLKKLWGIICYLKMLQRKVISVQNNNKREKSYINANNNNKFSVGKYFEKDHVCLYKFVKFQSDSYFRSFYSSNKPSSCIFIFIFFVD